MKRADKIEIFKLLLKHPEFAGHLRWTDPRKPGLGMRWTRTDLDLYKSMGGRFGSDNIRTRSKKSPTRSVLRKKSQ